MPPFSGVPPVPGWEASDAPQPAEQPVMSRADAAAAAMNPGSL
ncbi:hypothetical protein [Microbacterium sp. ISL-103]|nr:hypothetical protein [Microbacterium sp. ISL-103]